LRPARVSVEDGVVATAREYDRRERVEADATLAPVGGASAGRGGVVG
jgi:hypothetical protein